MYTGFKLDYDHYDDKYFNIGKSIYDANKNIVEKKLETFFTKRDSLNGTSIQNNWFPTINADIFISHSHIDEKLSISLAGMLYSKFNLTCFVDSCIWGYSNELLEMIDKKYCLNEDKKSFDYNKRNYSTSHVHMMLCTSLMMMIDKAECIFFLDTPNSLNSDDIIEKTLSPWIYAEISMTKHIRKKELKEYRQEIIKSHSLKEDRAFENFSNLSIEYDVDLNHFRDIDMVTIRRWRESYIPGVGHSLDYLYKITS